MTYIIKAKDGRGYKLESPRRALSLESVWNLEKCWFGHGCEVTISDEYGNSKVFKK